MNYKKILSLGTIVAITVSNTAIYAAAEDAVKVKEQTAVGNDRKIEKEIVFTLEEAIQYALKNSKDIEIQEIELQKAQISYDQNKRSIRESEKNIENFPLRNYGIDETTGAIVVSEAIEDGTVTKSLIEYGVPRRSLELSYNIAQWNIQIKENQVRYNAEKAYFDLSKMKKDLQIAEENLKLSQKQYDSGKLKLNLGTISERELLSLDLSLTQAQTTHDSAKVYYNLQLMNFQNTLGLPFYTEVTLLDEIEYKGYEPIDIEKAVKEAMENNIILKVMTENHELSELTLKATKARYPENTFRYREKEVQVLQSEKNLATTKSGTEMGVRSAYLNLLTAEKQIKTLEKSVEQAESMVRLAEISFELGQDTAIGVSQANLNLMNAKKSLSSQIHEFNMALLDFQYSLGMGKTLVGGM